MDLFELLWGFGIEVLVGELCKHVLIVAIALAIMAIVFLQAGKRFGVSDVFWHPEEWDKRWLNRLAIFFNGVGVAMLLSIVAIVGFVLDFGGRPDVYQDGATASRPSEAPRGTSIGAAPAKLSDAPTIEERNKLSGSFENSWYFKLVDAKWVVRDENGWDPRGRSRLGFKGWEDYWGRGNTGFFSHYYLAFSTYALGCSLLLCLVRWMGALRIRARGANDPWKARLGRCALFICGCITAFGFTLILAWLMDGLVFLLRIKEILGAIAWLFHGTSIASFSDCVLMWLWRFGLRFDRWSYNPALHVMTFFSVSSLAAIFLAFAWKRADMPGGAAFCALLGVFVFLGGLADFVTPAGGAAGFILPAAMLFVFGGRFREKYSFSGLAVAVEGGPKRGVAPSKGSTREAEGERLSHGGPERLGSEPASAQVTPWKPQVQLAYDEGRAAPCDETAGRPAGREGAISFLETAAILRAPRTWEKPSMPATNKPPLVLVCASGGGIFAANWTMNVLCQLEQLSPKLPYYIRTISGASGGMVGASHYVATLLPPQRSRTGLADNNGVLCGHAYYCGLGTKGEPQGRNGESVETVEAGGLIKDVGRDFLSPVVRRLAIDLPLALFTSKRIVRDRGHALGQAWERYLHGSLHQPLAQLAQGEREGWRPSLIFSPMIVETGQRLLISNLDLGFLCGEAGFQKTAYEFHEIMPGRFEALEVVTAARMSASFPVISPAAWLPTKPPLRVVDAGYYDNYGVNVAMLWLHGLIREMGGVRKLKEALSGVLLIEIDLRRSPRVRQEQLKARGTKGGKAPPSNGLPLEEGRGGFVERILTAAQDFSSPAEGLFSASNSAMSFRNDELVRILGHILNEDDPLDVPPAEKPRYRRNPVKGDGRFFTKIRFSCDADVPLSWSLTAAQENTVREFARKAVTEEKTLNAWLAHHLNAKL